VRTPGILPPQAGKPFQSGLVMTNSGHSPTKNVFARFVLEVVPNGRSPKLAYKESYLEATQGAFFPNDPRTLPPARCPAFRT
jgi:hypothetical protein